MKFFRYILIICFALSFVSGCKNNNVPRKNVFDTFKNTNIKKAVLGGKNILRIENGDCVNPKFSPDGKHLAYSKVSIYENKEIAEIEVVNLESKETINLLDTIKSNEFAVYKTYVLDIRWIDNHTLYVDLSDGDVDSQTLIFDIVDNKFVQSNIDNQELNRKYDKQILNKFKDVFNINEDVASTVLKRYIEIPNYGCIGQKQYANEDHNVWFYDFQKREKRVLIELTEDNLYSFHGGIKKENEVLLFISDNRSMNNKLQIGCFLLYDLSQNKIFDLISFDVQQQSPKIDIKYNSSDIIIFQIKAFRPHTKGNNPLFSFGNQLIQHNDYPELYDLDISKNCDRIALTYWNDNVRNITVHELNINTLK